LLARTGARGLMIGRGAIRNPWLFGQIRQRQRGEPATLPTGRQVLAYIHALWEAEATPDASEAAQVQRLKKFMNYIGEGVAEAERFLYEIRRVTTRAGFFAACARHLDHDGLMTLEPAGSAADHCQGTPELVAAKVISPGLKFL
jgi:tRNA-dihydrouridine synthase